MLFSASLPPSPSYKAIGNSYAAQCLFILSAIVFIIIGRYVAHGAYVVSDDESGDSDVGDLNGSDSYAENGKYFSYNGPSEIADNLDSLNSALNLIEEHAYRIRVQLLEILTLNRKIRQSIREENEKMHESKKSDANKAPSLHENTEPNSQ